jgi:hypothetical protein
VIGAAALAALALAYAVQRGVQRMPDGPRNLAHVAQIADALGLHYRSDRLDGQVVGRLIVSDTPIDFDRASALRFGDPEGPCWKGTVAVSFTVQEYREYMLAGNGIAWGEVHLYGDPAIIRMLTTAQVPAIDPPAPPR